ncbi:hypothetical protein BB561_004648 [Smittium simulii]|uniref:Uncharacterized protein n=1 Tax=Smittium simulii TaxID=133385 RepID=A0A2T9YF09_9FUNG|nr:hypothetical protein BB561_004648 [Smittium simulii]
MQRGIYSYNSTSSSSILKIPILPSLTQNAFDYTRSKITHLEPCSSYNDSRANSEMAGQFSTQQAVDSEKLLQPFFVPLESFGNSLFCQSQPSRLNSANFSISPSASSQLPELSHKQLHSTLISDFDFLPTPYLYDNDYHNSSIHVYGSIAPLETSSNLQSSFCLDSSNFVDPSQVFETSKFGDKASHKIPSFDVPSISDLIVNLGNTHSIYDSPNNQCQTPCDPTVYPVFFSEFPSFQITSSVNSSDNTFDQSALPEVTLDSFPPPVDLNSAFYDSSKQPQKLSSNKLDSFRPLSELHHSSSQDTQELMSLFICSSAETQSDIKTLSPNGSSSTTSKLFRTKSNHGIDFQNIFNSDFSGSNLEQISEDPNENCCNYSDANGSDFKPHQSTLNPNSLVLQSKVPHIFQNTLDPHSDCLQNRSLSKNILEANSYIKGGKYAYPSSF